MILPKRSYRAHTTVACLAGFTAHPRSSNAAAISDQGLVRELSPARREKTRVESGLTSITRRGTGVRLFWRRHDYTRIRPGTARRPVVGDVSPRRRREEIHTERAAGDRAH